ncbi:GtrA family protein [Pseudoxanthomonas dokdonensis]|uniref:GtrA/DPMS transmembrane domain-containing protein n=1 Tax=Pseudoxanthomonas dokdonensis TaxID=344882 RepID=A0A0R0CQL6_9GAMM|nr:GtrA family protein [Pseudoxanthomonas dokdonensis]KRG71638.1 hypothetical protein ABB29_02450 [Pseudoxanthomonas dokdonensis]
MTLVRQGTLFVLMGLVQLALDTLVTVLLSRAGMPLAAANVAGRVSGAALGFWLNGRVTFARADSVLGRRQALRFLIVWLALTLVSTALVAGIGQHATLRTAWLAKPVVEVMLAGISFFISRHWIYR